jgi:hypothetical protein
VNAATEPKYVYGFSEGPKEMRNLPMAISASGTLPPPSEAVVAAL